MDRYQSTFNMYNKVAQLYQDKFMDLNLYNDTYDLFCQYIKKQNAPIFEIACGPGNITRYILTKRPDFIIEAIDMAPNMLELAKINNPTAHFQLMDCRDIDTLNSKYDGIICGFCLPYLSKQDCLKLIKDSRALLNADGILYLSAIEGDESLSGYETNSKGEDPIYINYYDEHFLTTSLIDHHYEILDIVRKPYMIKEDVWSTHLIIIAKRNQL